LLEEMGIAALAAHKIGQISGGERQRAAIARALITDPACVLADEPTGNLDAHTAAQISTLLCALNEKRQMSLIIVTHDERLASEMQRTFTLKAGRLE